MVFKPIHKPCTVSFYLLRGRDCQKDYLRELLSVKRSEYAASQDHWPLVFLLFNDYHSFVDPVHDESDDVRPRHSRQLFRNDVFKVNQMPHAFERPN